jgi:hypothetical protein
MVQISMERPVKTAGEAEESRDGDEGRGSRCVLFSAAESFFRDIGPGKKSERVDGEQQDDVGVDGRSETADQGRVTGEQEGGEGGEERKRPVGQSGEQDEQRCRPKNGQHGWRSQLCQQIRREPGQDADGMKKFARKFRQPPHRIEEELHDPQREDAELGQAQQAGTGLLVQQF